MDEEEESRESCRIASCKTAMIGLGEEANLEGYWVGNWKGEQRGPGGGPSGGGGETTPVDRQGLVEPGQETPPITRIRNRWWFTGTWPWPEWSQ